MQNLEERDPEGGPEKDGEMNLESGLCYFI